MSAVDVAVAVAVARVGDVVLKLGDVGDAKVLFNTHNTGVGTPLFRAPEIGSGRYTTKVDVFSVGASMSEAVLRCIVGGDGALLLDSSVYMDRCGDMVADAAARVESRCPELSLLLRECCSMEPGDRPDAATAMRRVSTLCALQGLREVVAADGGGGGDVRVDAVSVQRRGVRVADDMVVALHRKIVVRVCLRVADVAVCCSR
jgi:serine/threonine protein kinase